ncbi:hypothetical protein FYK46_03370 [Staphylococcus aureus]|nr:hypothetical protein FYK46_03370 [Staphylococcus aureus]
MTERKYACNKLFSILVNLAGAGRRNKFFENIISVPLPNIDKVLTTHLFYYYCEKVNIRIFPYLWCNFPYTMSLYDAFRHYFVIILIRLLRITHMHFLNFFQLVTITA